MFIPNNYCFMRKKGKGYTANGGYIYGPKTQIQYGLVRFDLKVTDSTVRADSSATRGNVKEFADSGRILVPTNIIPQWGDIFIIEGKTFRAMQVEPRYNVLGRLDHFQVDLEKAEDAFGDEVS